MGSGEESSLRRDIGTGQSPPRRDPARSRGGRWACSRTAAPARAPATPTRCTVPARRTPTQRRRCD